MKFRQLLSEPSPGLLCTPGEEWERVQAGGAEQGLHFEHCWWTLGLTSW